MCQRYYSPIISVLTHISLAFDVSNSTKAFNQCLELTVLDVVVWDPHTESDAPLNRRGVQLVEEILDTFLLPKTRVATYRRAVIRSFINGGILNGRAIHIESR